MKKRCFICKRIKLIKQGKNPYFVEELETGYVVLGDSQQYHGYTLLICKNHTDELHKLEPKFRQKFLKEMSTVAEAVYRSFKPKKLNYELLGNTAPHLHWHIFPRYNTDPNPNKPVWLNFPPKKIEQDRKEIENLKSKLKQELKKVINKNKRSP